jgi:hypothetical protein
MGLIYADVELINGGDLEMARRCIIGDDEVRKMPVNILVDTGGIVLCNNETIQEQLQFPVTENEKLKRQMAGL